MEQLAQYTSTVKLLAQEALASKLATKTGAALQATGAALYLWGEVLLIVGGPPARKWWRWQLALSPQELYIEAGVVGACFALYSLRRWLKRKQFGARLKRTVRNWRRAATARYRAVQDYVAHQSRLAAFCLPHACYLGVCYLVLRTFPSLGVFLCEGNTAEKVAIVVRVLITLVVIADAEAVWSRVDAEPTTGMEGNDQNSGEAGQASNAPTTPGNGGSNRPGASTLRRRRTPAARSGGAAETSAAMVTPQATPITSATPSRSPAVNLLTMLFSPESGSMATTTRSCNNSSSSSDEPGLNPALRQVRSQERSQERLRSELMYWVCFAGVVGLQRFAASLPLVARAAAAVGASHRLSLAYALLLVWLQLPIGAVALAFGKLAPILERATTFNVLNWVRGRSSAANSDDDQPRGAYPAAVGGGWSPTSSSSSSPGPSAQLWAGLRMLTYTGVISTEAAAALTDICADGWVLLALVFLATPGGFLTQVGCLLAGLVWPAACSALLVGATGSRALQRQLQWAKYWACYASLLHAGHELERTGLWQWAVGGHHLHLLLVVWLQVPYFRGAPRLHAYAIDKLSAAFVNSSSSSSSSTTARALSPSPPLTLSAGEEGNYPPVAVGPVPRHIMPTPSAVPVSCSESNEAPGARATTPLPARVDELKED